MAQNFQQMHDPFASAQSSDFDPFSNPQTDSKKDELSFFDQIANRDSHENVPAIMPAPQSNSNISDSDFFNSFGGAPSIVSAPAPAASAPTSNSLFDENDILNSFEGKPKEQASVEEP